MMLRPSQLEGTLWQSNIVLENLPFIDDLPIKNGDCPCYVSLPQGKQLYGQFLWHVFEESLKLDG